MFYKFPIFYSPDQNGGAPSTPEPTPAATPAETANGSGGDSQSKTFTQDELNNILKDRLARAEKSAAQSVLDSLGIQSIDAAKTALGELQQLKDSQLSESEKLQKALDAQKALAAEASTSAQKAIAQANERLMRAAVIEEAAKSEHGIRETARGDVWMFIEKDGIEMDDSGNFKGVKEAITKVLESRSYLKKEESATRTPGTPNRTMQRGNRPVKNGNQPAENKRPVVRF